MLQRIKHSFSFLAAWAKTKATVDRLVLGYDKASGRIKHEQGRPFSFWARLLAQVKGFTFE